MITTLSNASNQRSTFPIAPQSLRGVDRAGGACAKYGGLAAYSPQLRLHVRTPPARNRSGRMTGQGLLGRMNHGRTVGLIGAWLLLSVVGDVIARRWMNGVRMHAGRIVLHVVNAPAVICSRWSHLSASAVVPSGIKEGIRRPFCTLRVCEQTLPDCNMMLSELIGPHRELRRLSKLKPRRGVRLASVRGWFRFGPRMRQIRNVGLFGPQKRVPRGYRFPGYQGQDQPTVRATNALTKIV